MIDRLPTISLIFEQLLTWDNDRQEERLYIISQNEVFDI